MDPGPRTTIASASVTGTPTEPAATHPRAPAAASPAASTTASALLERLLAYESDLRGEGFYAAAVRETTTFSDAGAYRDRRGGGGRRACGCAWSTRAIPCPGGSLESLVPVREERSVDEDLLEDASRNIEAYLRERGYRAAQAPYARAERSGELVLTFTVTRGPLHRVNNVSVGGQHARCPAAEIEPLLKLNKR